ncbi:anthrone oxygenase family protein [Streptomyces salinarius]|uniref:anthrone oxygenase family protein n=1 Tax=Streptomyces salinarius TaxID=2762598 RepID=UPI001F08FE08|nr:anthrone oxygenase family protein [Streptomyces salinarius]
MAEINGVRRSRTAGGVLVAATVATGLMAGTFYVFACAVMPALARSDDRVYVDVMRDINEVIENAVFLPVFLGALVLAGLAGWQSRRAPGRWWVWAGATAYALAFLVTVAGNVPLNDALARSGDPAALRERFEDPWLAWNAVRAALSTLATGCLAAGLARRGRASRSASGAVRQEAAPAAPPGAPGQVPYTGGR